MSELKAHLMPTLPPSLTILHNNDGNLNLMITMISLLSQSIVFRLQIGVLLNASYKHLVFKLIWDARLVHHIVACDFWHSLLVVSFMSLTHLFYFFSFFIRYLLCNAMFFTSVYIMLPSHHIILILI